MTNRVFRMSPALPVLAVLVLASAWTCADEPRAQREPPKPDPSVVSGGHWEPFRVLAGLSADFLVAPEPAEHADAEIGAQDIGAHFVVAAAALGGKGELRRLLEDLLDKIDSGITFLEPGREGRAPAVAARAQLERWRERLRTDRLSFVDLFHIVRWIRTYYASPRFLSAAGQMRLYLTLGNRRSRPVERVPTEGKALWSFLEESVGAGEFVVSGVDRNHDGAIDEWVMLGKDRRGHPFAYAPWLRGEASGAVLKPDDDRDAIAKILKECVVFDERDHDNPGQMMARRVFRVGAAE